MYIPRHYALDDPHVIAAAIEGYPFAALVTATGAEPTATHLPFMFDPDRGTHGTLVAHMARANPQWQEFAAYEDGGLALVIFSGPHAYVSPTWYGDNGPIVPTWNYLAVHAYGRPRIVDEPSEVRAILDRLVDVNEASLDPSWTTATQSEDYLERMMRGIVAFEIPLERIEAKAKLSQNRPDVARLGAAEALERSDRSDDVEIARLMRDVDSGG